MARIGVLKGSDVRCLSSTFMAVVIFACVILLTLQPSQYPSKISMVDLPKDEVVRAQSIAELDPTISSKGGGKGTAKDKKTSKNDKNNKKANKAKLFKDELPKKVKNITVIPTPPSLKEVGGADGGATAGGGNAVQEMHIDGKKNEQIQLDVANGNSNNDNKNQDNNDNNNENTNSENKNVGENQNANNNQDTNNNQEKNSNQENQQTSENPQKSTEKSNDKSNSFKARNGPRSMTPFSNLSNLPLKSFMSPFIDPDAVIQKPTVKIVTWFKPDNPQAISKKRGVFDDCPISACKVIYPLPPQMTPDAIVFEKIDKEHPPPPRINHDQAYILHMMSPPVNQQTIWPPAWNSAFNWTWTYRRDSDIWQPIGLLRKSHKVKSADFFLELTKGKTRMAVYNPRTCSKETSSKRDEYVEELKKHMKIAPVGPCFNKTCGKEGMSCTEVLSKKFFFLLAFEDSLCKDHVTEVFYRAWQEDTYIVPVVRGGADYSAYFPEGTFVDADWFDSPKKLAEFLTELMNSRRLYSQLLWRRSHWVRASRTTEDLALCHLCYKLHHLDSTRKRYRDITRWLERSSCTNPRPF